MSAAFWQSCQNIFISGKFIMSSKEDARIGINLENILLNFNYIWIFMITSDYFCCFIYKFVCIIQYYCFFIINCTVFTRIGINLENILLNFNYIWQFMITSGYFCCFIYKFACIVQYHCFFIINCTVFTTYSCFKLHN